MYFRVFLVATKNVPCRMNGGMAGNWFCVYFLDNWLTSPHLISFQEVFMDGGDFAVLEWRRALIFSTYTVPVVCHFPPPSASILHMTQDGVRRRFIPTPTTWRLLLASVCGTVALKRIFPQSKVVPGTRVGLVTCIWILGCYDVDFLFLRDTYST